MRETRCKIQKCLLLWKLPADNVDFTVFSGSIFKRATKSCGCLMGSGLGEKSSKTFFM